MKPWMIVLSSSIGAVAAAAVIAIPELSHAPRSDIGPILLAHWPVPAVAALAVYALIALLLTTIALVAEILGFRLYLTRTNQDRGVARRDWGMAFATGFRQLAPRLSHSAAAASDGPFDAGFGGSEAKGQISRLYYISLARSHFQSAVILLAGIVALGLAQDHGPLPLQPAAIPTASAAVIMAGLVLLYILGRIAVDVTAEPLLETMSQLVGERVEIGLLRRAVELLEMVCNTPSNDAEASPPPPVPERLVAAIEQGQQALADAASRLSANTEVLEATMRSSVETFETTIRTAAAQQHLADDDKIAGTAALPELQAAVEELTAVLRRLSASPGPAPEQPLTADRASPSRPSPTPQLARELRQLLQEIDAAQ